MKDLVSQSSCSLTNTTCVCLNAQLSARITLCVSQNCTIKESLSMYNGTYLAGRYLTMIVTEKYSYTTCGVEGKNKTKLVSVTGIVGLFIALTVYVLRMYAKIKTGFGMDDLFISLAMVRLFCQNYILSSQGVTVYNNSTFMSFSRPLV